VRSEIRIIWRVFTVAIFLTLALTGCRLAVSSASPVIPNDQKVDFGSAFTLVEGTTSHESVRAIWSGELANNNYDYRLTVEKETHYLAAAKIDENLFLLQISPYINSCSVEIRSDECLLLVVSFDPAKNMTIRHLHCNSETIAALSKYDGKYSCADDGQLLIQNIENLGFNEVACMLKIAAKTSSESSSMGPFFGTIPAESEYQDVCKKSNFDVPFDKTTLLVSKDGITVLPVASQWQNYPNGYQILDAYRFDLKEFYRHILERGPLSAVGYSLEFEFNIGDGEYRTINWRNPDDKNILALELEENLDDIWMVRSYDDFSVRNGFKKGDAISSNILEISECFSEHEYMCKSTASPSVNYLVNVSGCSKSKGVDLDLSANWRSAADCIVVEGFMWRP
jgi:hypothetical protein